MKTVIITCHVAMGISLEILCLFLLRSCGIYVTCRVSGEAAQMPTLTRAFAGHY